MSKLEDIPGEEWRDIEDAPGYKVSNMGRVLGRAGLILKASPNKGGYPSVGIRTHKKESRTVHRIVLTTFSGVRPEGMQARHLDGDKMNARLGNLVWGTPKENGQDRVRHGMQVCGDRTHSAKLTWEQVRKIRAAYDASPKKRGWGAAKFAREFGIHRNTVRKTALRQKWIEEEK